MAHLTLFSIILSGDKQSLIISSISPYENFISSFSVGVFSFLMVCLRSAESLFLLYMKEILVYWTKKKKEILVSFINFAWNLYVVILGNWFDDLILVEKA